MRLKYNLILFFLITALFNIDNVIAKIMTPGQLNKKGPLVRIRVAKQLSKVEISGLDLKRILYFKDDYKSYAGRKSIRFNCKNLKKQKSLVAKPYLLASLSSQAGLIGLNKDKYTGKILILSSTDLKSCDVVNEVYMDDYIAPLLSKEMNGNWPIEALKAQAVAARSYALHKIKSKQVSRSLGYEAYYHLESSEKHQVGGTFFDITSKTLQAVKDTKGEILETKRGVLTPVFFHAECGAASTLLPQQVWGNRIEGYVSVPCPSKLRKKNSQWTSELSIIKLRRFFKWAFKKKLIKTDKILKIRVANLRLVPDKFSALKLRVYVGERPFTINKIWFRRYFGRRIFRSNHFVINKKLKKFIIKGLGRGHGVGMSQLGAKRLADMGWSYRKILSYYFPEHQIKKIY